MSFSEWKDYKVGETCQVSTGFPFKSIEYLDGGKFRVVRGDNVKSGFTYWKEKTRCWNELSERLEKYILKEYDLVIGMDGSRVGKNKAIISKADLPSLLAQRVACVRANDGFNQGYISYVILSNRFENYVESIKTGTSIPHISLKQISDFTFKAPPLEKQKTIANMLSSLDAKIQTNNKINENIQLISQLLFKQWFVDFDFLNEEGLPYKSSGGEMVESELGVIPRDWYWGSLNDVLEFYDSKRVPLSAMQRENMEKLYPYYGAASLVDYVNDYIFDGIYVLVSEDGANVVDEKGYPLVQYVWNKFWVNNHAHVLKGKNGFSEQSIYIMLKNTNMQAIVTGAVQPKINQANLKSVKILIPTQDIIQKFNDITDNIFQQYRIIDEQKCILVQIRDTLLQKLMNGEIDLDNLEINL